MRNTRILLLLSAVSLVSIVHESLRAVFVEAQTTELNGQVVCRVMESFTDEHLGVTTAVFHQRDKADGPRLGEILLKQSGETLEIVTADGRSHRVTVFRVKCCFGRGLLLLPMQVKLPAGAEFILKPSHAHL